MLRFERLEPRYALCGPEPLDVNSDGYVTPIDALVAINALNDGEPVDTNCDGVGTARDVLRIVNYVNAVGDTQSGNVSVQLLAWATTARVGASTPIASIRVTGTGEFSIDLLLAIDGEQVTSEPLEIVSNPWVLVERLEGDRLGTVWRLTGRVETRADLVVELRQPVKLGDSLELVGVWQRWVPRLNQQISQVFEVSNITILES
jgi:hypothetical protein